MPQKDVVENLDWYREQCNALVIAAVPLFPLPLPKKEDHSPQKVNRNGAGLLDGNQEIAGSGSGISALPTS